jgi:hypothetical protein
MVETYSYMMGKLACRTSSADLCPTYYYDVITSLDELMFVCFSCVMQELHWRDQHLVVSRQQVFVYVLL